ncbi:hypothetical protein [Paenibacillus barengoltzii]|uniref:Rad50/SbcC-type AAA domain-containing protein n=1 Tax=Paenibacillus barengoltzii J12 TaxID=935846 RepID=A0ABY1LYG6_9BACL|nr:hypothetical protein [Paenibacillus barengoltzii]SMF33637.1 hypothetical protein SAMN02744124_02513 [Paenibacillus barengoltzii J12]
MKRLQIKKLIVISDFEKASKEIDLKAGLNIILGENKTGKSSLIKSIFHTFGCGVKFEDDWLKLVNKFILFFYYGEREYCLLRHNKTFSFFVVEDKNKYKLICVTESFHDFSAVLMNQFEVSMDCLTNKGLSVSATPPLLFRFQYIDQDMGWHKIGESFSNMKYIENWDSNTNKYVVGYQGEDYYKARQELLIVRDRIEELKIKIRHFSELMKTIENNYSFNDSDDIAINASDFTKVTLDELNQLEKDRIKLEEKISEYKNIIYERNLQLVSIKTYINELEKDHNFAMKEKENLRCPFCGSNHENTLLQRLEIVKDIQSGNQLLKQTRAEIKELEGTLQELINNKSRQNNRYTLLKKQLELNHDTASIARTLKNEGKKEIITSGNKEMDKLNQELSKEIATKEFIEEKLNEFNSVKRRNKIVKEFRKYYETILQQLNLPLSVIKLSDFVQKLNKTGSDMPRIIYAYHLSLYLYNLNRIESPFNFLVIDTPNQQGQDGKNLKNIDSVMSYLLDKRGQVIIGSERETGYEDQAEKVIHLTEVRRCLERKSYDKHSQLFFDLSQIENPVN